MDEDDLRAGLRSLADAQPPMRGSSAQDLRRGHRRLAVQRVATGAGALGVGAAAVVGVTVLSDGQPDTQGQVGFSDGGDLSDAEIVDQCLDVRGSMLGTERFADADVVVSDQDESGVAAALVSADGTRWAECRLHVGDDGDLAGVAYAYRWEPSEPGRAETNHMGFRDGVFTLVDRFAPEVARVEITVDDSTDPLTADVVDGFVAFQRDIPGTGAGLFVGDVVLYDADGNVLADGRGSTGNTGLPQEWRTLVPQVHFHAEPLDD